MEPAQPTKTKNRPFYRGTLFQLVAVVVGVFLAGMITTIIKHDPNKWNPTALKNVYKECLASEQSPAYCQCYREGIKTGINRFDYKLATNLTPSEGSNQDAALARLTEIRTGCRSRAQHI